MTERPILFSAPMVLALLAGTKTQTRRILKAPVYSGVEKFYFGKHPFAPSAMVGTPAEGMKLGPEKNVWCAEDWCGNTIGVLGDSPYGVPGDRLWVRETWAPCEAPIRKDSFQYAADGAVGRTVSTSGGESWWNRSGHTLGISESTAIGVWVGKPKRWRPSIHMPRKASRLTLEITGVRVERLQNISGADAMAEGCASSPDWQAFGVVAYRQLWESINGVGSWAKNPWVWVIEFKRLP